MTSDERIKLIALLEKIYLGQCMANEALNPDFIVSTFEDFEKIGLLPDEAIKGKIIQFREPMVSYMAKLIQASRNEFN